MRTLSRAIVVFLGLGAIVSGNAQTTIEELVAQTGVEAGSIAMRDTRSWRSPKKIVLRNIGAAALDVEQLLPGVEVVVVDSETQAIANADAADAIIGWCSQRLLAAANEASWVQIFSAGAERCMATTRIADGSVVLTNMQKMSAPVIAEHTIAMTLTLARQFPYYLEGMSRGDWLRYTKRSDEIQTIAGKTMLIAGLGGIGTEIARRAAAFDMRVIGTRRSSREGPEFVEYVGLADELPKLAGEADFIVIALPLTPDTEGLVDSEFLAATKRGAYLLNVGRGKIVDTDALMAALERGQLAGAGLDVTDPEPLPADHPLWKMENVLITPHVSSRGSNFERRLLLLKENLRRFAAGDALLNTVDPALGY